MKGSLHQRARMDKAALSVSVWPVGDGIKEALRKRLDRAIVTADRLGLDTPAHRYRAELDSPVGFALMRHFAAELCGWIEMKDDMARGTQTVIDWIEGKDL